MMIPPDFAQEGEHKVYQLMKSIYGLKQASRQWFQKLTTGRYFLGYEQSKANYSLFTKVQGYSFIALLIYVDDVVIASMTCHVLLK